MANGYIPAEVERGCDPCRPTRVEQKAFLGGVLGIDVNGERQPISEAGIVDLTFIEEETREAAEQAIASAQAAAESEQTASEAAASARSSESAAQTAANAAEVAQAAAEDAARSANASKNTADSYATAAQTAAAQAQNAYGNAERSAESAIAAAAQAASSAGSALSSANDAYTSASTAQAAADAAQTAQAAAEASEATASTAATTATQAKTAAQAAQTAAEAAQATAAQSATAASGSATAAAGSATQAAASATAADASADAAAQSAATLTLDATLTSATQAAQAKAVGDELTNLKSHIYKNPSARVVSDNVAPAYVQSINLLNPNDPDLLTGKFINGTNGSLSNNASYNTTGYIPVSEGQKIAFTCYNQYGSSKKGLRTVAAYDSAKELVPSAGTNTESKIYSVPHGVSFIRFSALARFWSDYTDHMVWDCHSDTNDYTVVDFQPYGNVYTDGVLQISSYPRFIKYGVKISFTAKINSFGNDDHIYIGWMDNSSLYQGYWEITSTSVIFHVGANTVLTTLTHGLTVTEYISCVITVHSDLPNFSVVINTKDGTYSAEQSGETTRTLLCGVPTLETSATLTNVVMSVSTSQAKNKVWVFGDSYMGYGSDRLLGSLFSWGFTENILVDALGGMNSTGAYQELNRLLEYGKPNVIVWMLGMNDNSEDLPIYSTLATFCDDNGIILILNKCPVVPSRISENTAQNAAVIATGKRYVDSYASVGCDGTGAWYQGMLSADNIHPTSTGAAAIASRMLIDAPEIVPN